MKRICFFLGSANLSGGTERVATIIANGLAEAGHNVSILSLSNGNNPFFDINPKISIHQIFCNKVSFKINYFIAIYRLRRFLKNNNIDVLIDVESMLALYAIPAVIGTGIRHICWEHFNYKYDLGKILRRIARHFAAIIADDVITLTKRDKDMWRDHTWARADIHAISNPTPFDIPPNMPGENSKTILAIGRLTHQKGFDILLKAWSKSLPHIPHDWKLRIVGGGEDENILRELSSNLQINDRTNFYPPTNEISKHYSDASFYCLSSRFEGLPMVLIEAQAYGLPIIAFDCETGPREIIEHLYNGQLVECGNIEALSNAIVFYVSNEEVRREASVNAKRKCYSFDKAIIVRQWLNLIG